MDEIFDMNKFAANASKVNRTGQRTHEFLLVAVSMETWIDTTLCSDFFPSMSIVLHRFSSSVKR